MRTAVAIFMFSVVAWSLPQQASVPLSEISSPRCPLRIEGMVTTTDEMSSGSSNFSFRTNVSATNVSTKDILLLVIEMDILGMAGFGMKNNEIDDYFFMQEAFKSSTTKLFTNTELPIGFKNDSPNPSSVSKATAKVMFVQFSDGSTWGASEHGRDALLQRRLTSRELARLEQTYVAKGGQELANELEKPSQLPVIYQLQRLYSSSDKDIDAVVFQIRKLLSNARSHEVVGGRSKLVSLAGGVTR